MNSLEPPSLSDDSAIDELVRETDAKSFARDVIEASKDRLVLLDFWAPWCGPCKQLVPLLEKLVRGQGGAVLLAKVNIDANPEIAQQMRVQSVPTVFAFFNGKPVDGFMGAQPESQLKEWIAQLVKATGAQAPGAENYDAALAQAASFLAANDAATARAIYEDILSEAPDNISALAGSLRAAVVMGEARAAEEKLASLPAEIQKDKAFDAVRSALAIAAQARKAGDVSALEAKLADDENDHQTRFDLALALYAAGNRERAVTEILEIVRRDRKWRNEAARKQLLTFFEAFGPTDPLTVSARKRLSSILFS